ncbi:MAG: phage portal protein [Phycisphaeraceae bacterium]|nr:phage portal protein [Phycisphaeraceae bacterium]
MAFNLEPFTDTTLSPEALEIILAEHERDIAPRLHWLWSYFRNEPPRPGADVPQAAGLPPRLRGAWDPFADDRMVDAAASEIVIENDIAWRIHTMVDFMLPEPLVLLSNAGQPQQRRNIEAALDAVWEASGGLALLHDALLMGHVYGHVDLLLRCDIERLTALAPDLDALLALPSEVLAEAIRVEAIDPARGVPIVDQADYRRLEAYAIDFTRRTARVDEDDRHGASLASERVTELFSGAWRQVSINGHVIDEGPNRATPGRVPVVHIQNIPQPLHYAGIGEVEPLIPLQDQLNTRLSDRAARVTMQSFKMYLAKGIEGFDQVRIGPGRILSTDNPDAQVTAFGGDADSPSETAHIEDIREAMDKVSGVPPIAAGVVRAKIGNLSSGNALRVTMLGLLSKTRRKRVGYGAGVARMSAFILEALDRAGTLASEPQDRKVSVNWPEAIDLDQDDRLISAQRKYELGINPERVLAELGYPVDQPRD